MWGQTKPESTERKKKKNPKTKQTEEIQDRQVASDRKWPRKGGGLPGKKENWVLSWTHRGSSPSSSTC